MQTIKLSDLRPHSYINHNGEIIFKEDAEALITAGHKPVLYTISDEWIRGALSDASQEFMNGEKISESYSAPDPHAKRILY